MSTRRPPFLENLVVFALPEGGYSLGFEPVAKRVRTFAIGTVVADSCRVMMMHESGRLPVYYIPIDDVRWDLFFPSGAVETSPRKGNATYYSLTRGDITISNAGWRYLDPLPSGLDVSGYVAFHWALMRAWYEEDEEVFVHARDPYHRIDILNSSRQVRVVISGQSVAETRHARFLFETGLPVRYYLPPEDVRLDLLSPTETRTACAYKGATSAYWGAVTAQGEATDVAWTYAAPTAEGAKIAGLICFFNERVDGIYVDGVEMPKPQTRWSLRAAATERVSEAF
jgi:uncharacterized protein (DUF427 family)